MNLKRLTAGAALVLSAATATVLPARTVQAASASALFNPLNPFSPLSPMHPIHDHKSSTSGRGDDCGCAVVTPLTPDDITGIKFFGAVGAVAATVAGVSLFSRTKPRYRGR